MREGRQSGSEISVAWGREEKEHNNNKSCLDPLSLSFLIVRMSIKRATQWNAKGKGKGERAEGKCAHGTGCPPPGD